MICVYVRVHAFPIQDITTETHSYNSLHTQSNSIYSCEIVLICANAVTVIMMSGHIRYLTRLLIGVNLVLRQCMHVEASPSGTHTAACSVAGLLLAGGGDEIGERGEREERERREKGWKGREGREEREREEREGREERERGERR